jgi:asparagine synthase (glutamine-hydrolysing)
MLVEVLRNGALEHPELFHAGTLETLMQQHFERRVNIGYQLWGLLILFQWMKKWNIQSHPIYETARTPAGILASI